MIQIGQKLSPTFQQPLELLSDCHRRVESFLNSLAIVGEQARGIALNQQQRTALETALRYFREAAPKHTADEEESLFPRMRELPTEGMREALAKIQALEADHQTARDSHDAVERLGQKWLSHERLSSEEASLFLGHVHNLQSIYVHHIAVEDKEIFPLAAKVLDAAKLKEVGREMAARRGQSFEGPSRFPTPRPSVRETGQAGE